MFSPLRTEWRTMLEHSGSYKFQCYPLQMKITKLKKDLKKELITKDEAVIELHKLCEKYARAVKNDVEHFFQSTLV
jgi:hypothetical protein